MSLPACFARPEDAREPLPLVLVDATGFEAWRGAQPASVQAWLKAPPSGLLRLKGFLLLDTGPTPQWVELQFAGRQGSVRKCAAPAGGAGEHRALDRAGKGCGTRRCTRETDARSRPDPDPGPDPGPDNQSRSAGRTTTVAR